MQKELRCLHNILSHPPSPVYVYLMPRERQLWTVCNQYGCVMLDRGASSNSLFHPSLVNLNSTNQSLSLKVMDRHSFPELQDVSLHFHVYVCLDFK